MAYVPYSNLSVGASLITDDGINLQWRYIESFYGLSKCGWNTAISEAVFEGKKIHLSS